MPSTNIKFEVHLSEEQRDGLEAICRKHSVATAKVRRAKILLMSDEAHPQGGLPDWEIAESVGISERQVVRIRQKFVREDEINLDRKPRPAGKRKIDGKAEAQLITLCCSDPPDGRDHWTLKLLCDELARLKVIVVSHETVRQCLKKTKSSPGNPNGFAFRKKTERVL